MREQPMTGEKPKGTTFVELLISVGLLFLLVTTVSRFLSESSLPQQTLIRQYPAAMRLAEKILLRLADEASAGRLAYGEGETDMTEAIVENRLLQEDLGALVPGTTFAEPNLRLPFRALLQVRYMLGKSVSDRAGSDISGVDGSIVRLFVRLEWGGRPLHRLTQGLVVPIP